uniref:Clathrin light chain n=1 Tax=Ganoderma boninense TaxID=34458 RepID=A0A5K1K5Z1_9APHY|nr:Polygalacturonase inhibiting protein (Polygalacturonase-inhibiting protein 2) (Putative polygalacturonase-inhibiting protein) [Ganoderma boninense]
MTDFLQRESDVLGEEFGTPTGGTYATADIDFDRAASAFPEISLDGTDDFSAPPPAAPPTQSTGSFSFDDFSSPPPTRTTEVKITGDDEIEKFESEFPDIEVPQVPQQPTQQPLFGQTPTFAPQPAYSSTPILNQALEEEEPEVIKEWREKQAAEIKARDEASHAKRQETIGKAERAIDQFYEEYALKKERNIRENKETEEKFLADMSAALSQGTTWERICDTVELQNSQSKTIARSGANATDLTRFKEVLLRLRREGAAAPGAAGY